MIVQVAETMMGKSRSLKWIIIVSLFLEIASFSSSISAAPQTVTYHNPIAYIGLDGNVYITSLDSTNNTALTVDGFVTSKYHHYLSAVLRYGGIHWSPDGTQFSFEDTVARKLYVVRSGKGPVQVPGAQTDKHLWQSAISPDNKQIAFLSGDYDNLVAMPVGGGESTTIGWVAGADIEQPDNDPAEIIRANELGYTPFDAAYMLEWTRYGCLTLTAVNKMKMLDSSGKVLWEVELYDDGSLKMTLPIISADGKHALIQHLFEDENGYGGARTAIVDLANGHLTPLSIPIEAKILAWTPDGQYVFYGTQSDPLSVYDEDTPSFAYVENTLSLWQVPISGGEPVLIFQRKGYAFGVVRVTADSKALVFSLVTASVNKVQAKLRHAPQAIQDAIEPSRSEIIELPLQKGATPRWIALGGNLGIGKGDFVVPVLPPPPSQSNTCATGTVPRLQVGQRAKVIESIRLFSEPLFYDTGYFVFMRLNAGKEVLVVGGPHCDDKGIVWWKVNYQSVVGWTPAEEGQIKWLEQ
jgi:hypothetical protein